MSDKAGHAERCERELGCSFPDVDAYLDQFYVPGGDDGHRQCLHHKQGVEIIREKFAKQYGVEYGDLAARAAEIHIMVDFGLDYVPTLSEVTHKLLAFTQAS